MININMENKEILAFTVYNINGNNGSEYKGHIKVNSDDIIGEIIKERGRTINEWKIEESYIDVIYENSKKERINIWGKERHENLNDAKGIKLTITLIAEDEDGFEAEVDYVLEEIFETPSYGEYKIYD